MTDELSPFSDDEGATRATALFTATWGGVPGGVWASPGRINLIGEHLDYNGGSVLPMALPHSTFVAFQARADDTVRLASTEVDSGSWEGSLESVLPGGDTPRWVLYAAGPAAVLAEASDLVTGFDAAIVSSVPLGAGLSSSAAIECAMALAINETCKIGLDAESLSAVCVRAENQVVGAPTGGMDQAASLRSEAGHALHLDCTTLEAEQVPFDLEPLGLALLVIDTQATHALVDGQYAARRSMCEAVAAREGVRTLAALPDPDATLRRLDGVELRRVRHVVTEIRRVSAFVDLLEGGRVAEVGPLLDASHASLRDDYEVSCPELDAACAAATASGALGARMTGGGFGGSAIALVPASEIETVKDAVRAAYAQQGWTPPRFLVATPGPAGRRVA